MHAFDVFVVISGIFSILATLPLLYLALSSYREGRDLHRVQREVAELVAEVREIQHRIHDGQQQTATDIVQTKETIERVARGRPRRRRLPRVRVELPRETESF